jgi:hypothetical protein
LQLHRFLASNDVNNPNHHHNFGYSVAGAGDVNGDGHDDLIIGTESIEADPKGRADLPKLFLAPMGRCFANS